MGVRIFGIAGSSNPAEDFRLAASGLFVPVSPLNNRSGVTSTPVLTGTGSLTCTVGPFSCLVDGTSNALQGSYWATLDSATTVTITTGASQSRIDLISLQILDNAYDGSGQQIGQVLYTAGTPGSGSAPTAPANTISLFTVTVPANATTLNFSTAATAVFPFTAGAGGIVPARSAADKPAVANAVQYRHRLDVTATAGSTSPLESSTDGANWHPVFDASVVPAAVTAAIGGSYGAWTNAVVNTPAFTIGVQPQYRTIPGNRIELRGWVYTTGAGTFSGSAVIGSLPVPASERMPNAAIEDSSGNTAVLLLGPGAGANTNTCYTFSSGSLSNCSIGFDGVTYSL